MQIQSSQKVSRPAAARPQTPATPAPAQDSVPQDSYEPGWIGAGVSAVAGAASVIGAFTDQPALALGGLAVNVVTSSMAAKRVQDTGTIDTAAKVTFAATGLAAGAQLLSMAMPEAQPKFDGPLPQLLDRLGVPHGY